jgi:P63C domain-containing protein
VGETNDGVPTTTLAAAHGSPDKPLVIGGIDLECYVLEDTTRVFAASGLIRALNIPETKTSPNKQLQRFFSTIAISMTEDDDLAEKLGDVVYFTRPGKGGHPTAGYRAELLPALCNAVLRQVQRSAVFPDRYRELVTRCRTLLHGFANVGIIALVDEATGFQNLRIHDELRRLLERFLLAHHAAWAKRFPDEFYDEIYRLRGWSIDPAKSHQRPQIIGKYTRDIVYSRLAPGVLEELERLNPTTETGQRTVRHHQFLTDEIGHPKLVAHLTGVLALMRGATTWEDFQRLLARSFPQIGEQHLLDLYGDHSEPVTGEG